MKKWITGALAILLGVMSIAGPFSGMHIAEAKTTEETDRKLNIVTTIFRNMTGQEYSGEQGIGCESYDAPG